MIIVRCHPKSVMLTIFNQNFKCTQLQTKNKNLTGIFNIQWTLLCRISFFSCLACCCCCFFCARNFWTPSFSIVSDFLVFTVNIQWWLNDLECFYYYYIFCCCCYLIRAQLCLVCEQNSTVWSLKHKRRCYCWLCHFFDHQSNAAGCSK